MQALWAKRETQITGILANVAGVYGSLQGCIGSSLPDTPGLMIGGPDAARPDQVNDARGELPAPRIDHEDILKTAAKI